MIDPDTGALYQLQDALCVLASDAAFQAEYVLRHGYGENLDELALEFNAWYEAGEVWVFHKNLTAEQLASLYRLDRQLDAMSGKENAQLWWAEALGDETWVRVRRFAKEALKTFGLEFGPGLRQKLWKRWPERWVRDPMQ